MSNPAVIVLAETTSNYGNSFRIEDNIGESIHLHYGTMRLDLTIREFLKLSMLIEESLLGLIQVEGFNLKEFDVRFLSTLGHAICDLESVKTESVLLSSLEVYTNCWLGKCVARLPKSFMYRALLGDMKEYAKYPQTNDFGEENIDRLSAVLKEIQRDGYGASGRYIVLFNDQNLIRDGQHRAAAAFYLEGDREVKILRMKFKNGRLSVSRYPWLWALPGQLLRLPRQHLGLPQRILRTILPARIQRHVRKIL